MLLESPLKNSGPYDKSSWDIFEIRPFSGQNRVNQGGSGGPRNSFFIGILLFMLLGSPCKTSRPYHKLSQDISEISPFSGQNRVNQGGQGGPPIFFLMGIFLFLLLGSLCKFLKSYDNPLWGFDYPTGRRKKEKIMPSLMATSALAHALHSDQLSKCTFLLIQTKLFSYNLISL